MFSTEYCYFDGSSVSITYDDCYDGHFMIICEDSFLYLMEKSNLEFSIVDKGNKVYTMYMNPYVDTYYIECDKNAFWKLVNKYCALTKEDSIKDDWDLYGSEFGKVEKKLHAYDIWHEHVLFSRSEDSDNRFYVSCSDSFHDFMRRVIDYKEIQMDDTDRFKNRENFKLIECDEESIFRFLYRLCIIENTYQSLVEMYTACE